MRAIKKILKKSFLYPLYAEKQDDKYWQYKIGRLEAKRGLLIDTYLPKGGVGAELGVFKGHFSRVLLNRAKSKELH